MHVLVSLLTRGVWTSGETQKMLQSSIPERMEIRSSSSSAKTTRARGKLWGYGLISWVTPSRRLRGNNLQRRILRTMTNCISIINLIPRGIHILGSVVSAKAATLAFKAVGSHAPPSANLLVSDGLNEDDLTVELRKNLHNLIEATVGNLPIMLLRKLHRIVVILVRAFEERKMIPVFGESYSELGVVTVTPPGPNDDRNLKLLPCFCRAGESNLHFLENGGTERRGWPVTPESANDMVRPRPLQ